MKKLRNKRIRSTKKQIQIHKNKIQTENPNLDTTKDYWQKEIDLEFIKKLKQDKRYLEEH